MTFPINNEFVFPLMNVDPVLQTASTSTRQHLSHRLSIHVLWTIVYMLGVGFIFFLLATLPLLDEVGTPVYWGLLISLVLIALAAYNRLIQAIGAKRVVRYYDEIAEGYYREHILSRSHFLWDAVMIDSIVHRLRTDELFADKLRAILSHPMLVHVDEATLEYQKGPATVENWLPIAELQREALMFLRSEVKGLDDGLRRHLGDLVTLKRGQYEFVIEMQASDDLMM